MNSSIYKKGDMSQAGERGMAVHIDKTVFLIFYKFFLCLLNLFRVYLLKKRKNMRRVFRIMLLISMLQI